MMIKKFWKKLLTVPAILALGASTAIAATTLPQYAQRTVIQDVYGFAYTATGSVNHLVSSTASPYPLNKAMWLFFPKQPNNFSANEWVELGGGKGLTATTIALPNPQESEQSYYEGHYFTYQRYTADGYRWYYEGRIGAANGVPSGEHRYKLQRDFSSDNKWCSFVNNTGAYCITIAGASTYNKAYATTIGLESQDTLHSFTNGTGGYNIWHYPATASGFQIFTGNMTNRDNNNKNWTSNYYPYSSSTGNNAIDFNRP